MLAHVPSFGQNPRGSPDFLVYPVPRACMQVLGTGLPRRLGVARSASSPKAAQALGCSLTPGLRILFGSVTCMARAASVPGLSGYGHRVSYCCVALVFRSRLSLGSGFGCAPPLLAGVLGCVCVCVRAPLVPRHSWLGCAVWVCVLGLGFRLRPATPGWGVGVCVCLCARPACTPPLLAGVCGVCVCVFGLRFRLRPATPGCGVGTCVCLCGCSAPTPPLLARVCGAGVCPWARVSAAPRQSWLGCWGLCVFVCALCLYPATPGWGVRCGFVCLGSGFDCAPPLLAGVFGCVCSCVRAALVPRHSWLGCAVWVCVLGLGSRLRPATPGWGVGVCVCLCVHSACTMPLAAPLCGVGACAGARVSAAPRQSWLGCWRLCACLCARSACTPPLLAGACSLGVCAWARVPAAPRHSWLGCAVWACVFGLGLWLLPANPVSGVGVCVFVCALRFYPATPSWGVGVCVCVCVRTPLVPCHSRLGCAVWVCVLGLGC